jgi:hypothetical protein
VVFRVSPHRHSQSLSRDVPSTIRLPSAIVPENDDEKDDIEKSTKKEIEEDLNIFCRRRRLKSCRAFFLPFWCSQKSFFFSRARERRRDVCDSLRRSTQLSTLIYTLHTRVCYNKSHDKMTTILAFLVQSEVLLLFSCAKGGETCADSLCRSLCSTKDARSFFFCREKEKRREEKNQKKKKIIIKRKVQKSSHQIALSSQIFRHASLFWKNWISSPVRHNNKRHSKIKIHTRHI